MRRNFSKMINKGAQILEDRPGMDMSLQEADALIASAESGDMRFSFHDAYCAGVAAVNQAMKQAGTDQEEKGGSYSDLQVTINPEAEENSISYNYETGVAKVTARTQEEANEGIRRLNNMTSGS